MAVTVTKVSGPYYVQGKGTGYTLSLALDTSFAASGEPIDISSYLGYLYNADVQGVDAIADATYLFTVVGPGRAVAVTSSNVLLEAVQSPAKTGASEAAEAFASADTADLSDVGALLVEIWGKKAIPSSWS